MRHHRSGPYQVQAAIAALHARAAKPEDTDWTQIDLLYGALEIMQPSPVVTLNRSVAVSKARGPEAALAMIEPVASTMSEKQDFAAFSTVTAGPLGASSSAARAGWAETSTSPARATKVWEKKRAGNERIGHSGWPQGFSR